MEFLGLANHLYGNWTWFTVSILLDFAASLLALTGLTVGASYMVVDWFRPTMVQRGGIKIQTMAGLLWFTHQHNEIVWNHSKLLNMIVIWPFTQHDPRHLIAIANPWGSPTQMFLQFGAPIQQQQAQIGQQLEVRQRQGHRNRSGDSNASAVIWAAYVGHDLFFLLVIHK